MSQPVRLCATLPAEAEQFGGKAAGLVRLLQAGLDVPDCWILTSADVASFTPDQATVFWQAFRAQHPRVKLAVRSSALHEDGAQDSFAGIYETVLDVSNAQDLFRAVVTCREAADSDRARSYAGDTAPEIPALVLQKMIAPDCAGVLMTRNPEEPFADSMVVEVVAGLGEALVSGQRQPQRYRLGADNAERLPDKLDQSDLLSPAQLAILHNAAQKVTTCMGHDRDLEWAFVGEHLYLLQDRPITGLPPRHPHNVWSRKFGDEYLADYTSPLGYTLLGRWIEEVFLEDFANQLGFAGQYDATPMRRYRGHVYVNGQFIRELLAGIPRKLRARQSTGWFSPLWEQRIADEAFRPAQLARAIKMLLTDPLSNLGRNQKAFATYCTQIEERIKPLLEKDAPAADSKDWQQQLDGLLTFGVQHFKLIRWSMGFHNPAVHGLLKERLQSWCNDDGRLYAQLLSDLPQTRTQQMRQALQKLKVSLSDAATGQQYAQLDENDRKKVDTFLQDWGHRCAGRDLMLPRWREDPDQVLQLVAGMASTAPQEKVADDTQLWQKIRQQAGWKTPLLRRLTQRARALTTYRENQRFFLDYILFAIRRLLLAQGEAWKNQGLIDQPEEVCYFEKKLFFALRNNKVDHHKIAQILRTARSEHEQAQIRLPLPYLFDEVETVGDDLPAISSDGIAGTAASAGTARGTVRVITQLADLSLVQRGDVLVTANIDPAWTVVFDRLAGLITETGGLLSHGAIVARESHLPAVTGVADATRIFVTGEMVEVDGSAGLIRRNTTQCAE